MTLYKKVQPLMPATKGVISDEEFILVNRKEFHLSQVSPTFALLQAMGARLGYPYRVLIALLDQFASACAGEDFNIILADGRLSIAAFVVWTRAGGNQEYGRIIAPRGLGKLPDMPGVIGEIQADFYQRVNTKADAKLADGDREKFTFVIGNSKERAQILYAADSFQDANKGLLLLKDYAHIDAPDEREYLESKRIFPAITFEGHALSLRLGKHS